MATQEDIGQLNSFGSFFSFQPTWPYYCLINTPHNCIASFTGNQYGKTASYAHQYVLRILGYHPVIRKNVLFFTCKNEHDYSILTRPEDNICTVCGEKIEVYPRISRIFRFASETLPGQKETVSADGQSSEVRNTVYPAFKQWLPKFLIKKDITARNPSMTIKDPWAGYEFGDIKYQGEDIVVEFVSYSQTVQSGAGVQRLSIWCDEEPNYEFWEEQLPRLLAENGDILISLTPASRVSWTFDELFERASVYYRTEKICDYLTTKEDPVRQIERTKSPLDIAVIQACTDDNPVLKPGVIEDMFTKFDDPDVVATRRYGLHRQVRGRIFKNFKYPIHFISSEEYFKEGIPHTWIHARGIDYHQRTPWACGMMSLSPQNEVFIWGAWNAPVEKLTTEEICRKFAYMGKGYKFGLNLVDPQAEAVKKDHVSVLQDINKVFRKLKQEGADTGSNWRVWDTKGEAGRLAIMERLKNSIEVKRPFNNMIKKDGDEIYLPTLWILDANPITWESNKAAAEYMRKWRYEEWKERGAMTVKDPKDSVQQKWSHMNMVWEAIFKEKSFRPRQDINTFRRAPRYFQGQ